MQLATAQCTKHDGIGFGPGSVYFLLYFIYLFIFGCIGFLLLCVAFSSCGDCGLLFVTLCRLLIVVASLVVEHRL